VQGGVKRKRPATAAAAVAGAAAAAAAANQPHFKIGQLLNHIGDIEGTGDAIDEVVAEHEKTKAADEAEKNAKQEHNDAKRRKLAESLPERLQAAKAKFFAPLAGGKDSTVKEARAYLQVEKEKAKLDKDDQRVKDVTAIYLHKGKMLVQQATVFANNAPVEADAGDNEQMAI